MTKPVRVCDVSEIPAGSAKEVVVEDRVLAVFNVDGEFHVLDGICPHAGGPLGQGQLDGNVVTCPWHGWQFDVQTGRHCLNETLHHERFETIVEDGVLSVRQAED